MKKQGIRQFNSFEELYNRNLPESELAEIKQNLFGFLDLLVEIDCEKNKNDRHNSSNNTKK